MVILATYDLNIIDEISLDNKSEKLSNEPDFAALYWKSYDMILPPQFGTHLVSGKMTGPQTNNQCVLPRFKTFEEFDSSNWSLSRNYAIL